VEEAKETFSGECLWQEFGETCEKAEAVRDLPLRDAKSKLSKFLSSMHSWTMCAPERIKKAAEARCAEKVKAAEDRCEEICGTAQQELFKALDERGLP
jgi:hypothetical protein